MYAHQPARRAAALGAAALAALLAAGGTAQASTTPRSAATVRTAAVRPMFSCDFTGTGVRIHTLPSTSSTTLGEGNPGDGFALDHWNENSLPYAYGTDIRTGVKGWVYYAYLTDPCN